MNLDLTTPQRFLDTLSASTRTAAIDADYARVLDAIAHTGLDPVRYDRLFGGDAFPNLRDAMDPRLAVLAILA